MRSDGCRSCWRRMVCPQRSRCPLVPRAGSFCGVRVRGRDAVRTAGHQPQRARARQAMSQYHWESDQEDFLVLAGQALLVIDGKERPLRAWDLIHCPAGVSHVILGAGTSPCVVMAVGARDYSTGADWGAYPVDSAALRHRAGVERETTEPHEAYAGMSRRKPVAFDPDWLARVSGLSCASAPSPRRHSR
jgi:uncharacterized protein YjlB